MRATGDALPIVVLGTLLLAAGCTPGAADPPADEPTAPAAETTAEISEAEPADAGAPVVLCADVAGDPAALQEAVLALLVEDFDPARVEEVVYYTANICTWDEQGSQPLVDALTSTNLVTEADLRTTPDTEVPSSGDGRNSWEAGTPDQEHIWQTCYAPAGYAAQVNTNPAVIDEVLPDYPDFWKDNAPVPQVKVSGVCHQHIPESGVTDVWWVSIQDPAAGYEAALAWDAQLMAAGAERYCQRELSEGPDAIYSCAYSVSGQDALISNSQGPTSLHLQPGV